MTIVNTEALNALAESPQASGVPAVLVDEEGAILYKFLYAPEKQAFSKSAKFTEVPVGGTARQPQVYGYTTGTTLRLDNLLLDTFCDGRSGRELIEGLGRLTNPDAETLKPELIYFVYGTFSFGPAYITDLSWETEAWLNGEPAVGRINITLIEVPGDATTATTTGTTGTTAGTTASTTGLTDRQKLEARQQADAWLSANINRLRPDIQQRVRSRSFKFLTNDTGTVQITDANNAILGTVGTWDGRQWSPNSQLLRS
ncbi:hypothetical protein IQ273_12900 [Nodosilinea sp. LEGE 07298]|uniref:hypothetical protein n=1 Tax=Nodosilinea sp. LEGE 07298 TaxID=2777970 RepID=UPI00188097EF|nr:hypothetical protein [Nodosilinea sp. LEGE 07298]MBE9110311.1 hypothetical protein [Nodosilinea sp. LEGE 07298]